MENNTQWFVNRKIISRQPMNLLQKFFFLEYRLYSFNSRSFDVNLCFHIFLRHFCNFTMNFCDFRLLVPIRNAPRMRCTHKALAHSTLLHIARKKCDELRKASKKTATKKKLLNKKEKRQPECEKNSQMIRKHIEKVFREMQGLSSYSALDPMLVQ